MSSANRVASLLQDSFGYTRLAVVKATALNTLTSNAATTITIPLLSGGLTNANATVGSGAVILRRITVNGSSGNVSLANISITTSNDQNISNAVVANVVLTNITAGNTYQDLNIAAPYNANTTVTGFQTQALYINVNTVAGNANTVNFSVYGDVVQF